MERPAEIESAIREAARGGGDAFRRLVEHFALPVRCYLASQVYRADDVDDLAQEVFLSAYRKIREFRAGSDFAGWLRGIARYEVLAYFRKLARRESALERFREEVARHAHAEMEQLASAAAFGSRIWGRASAP